jgi:hypothetical protein
MLLHFNTAYQLQRLEVATSLRRPGNSQSYTASKEPPFSVVRECLPVLHETCLKLPSVSVSRFQHLGQEERVLVTSGPLKNCDEACERVTVWCSLLREFYVLPERRFSRNITVPHTPPLFLAKH